MYTKNIKRLIAILMIFSVLGITNAQEKQICENKIDQDKSECLNKVVTQTIYQHLAYPHEALVNGVEGKVIVRFATDENNNITRIKVVGDNYDDKLFSESVIKAVQLAAIELKDQALASNEVYAIPVEFVLDF